MTGRYYSIEDPVGVTPSRLNRMSQARQWPYVRHWFRSMFEDPANETPRMDGEFTFIWGGPYDALEELQHQFPDIPFERLEAFARSLEDDGVLEWAPGRDHPDYTRAADEARAEFEPPELDEIIRALEDGARPHLGDAYEHQGRLVILERVDRLEELLTSLTAGTSTPGIGHNNPPTGQNVGLTIDVTVAVEMKEAAGAIRAELAKPAPDTLEVARQTSRLKKLSGLLFKVAGTVALAGIAAVTKQVVDLHPELGIAADALIMATATWLWTILAP